jgi:predicted RNA binding protein YcfA (HicA-like mRNA interferase family)
MQKAIFTYHDLDERLRALGFSVHIQKGRARIYRHEQRGASVILPDVPFDEEVLPHHLAVTRHALQEYDMADLEMAKPFL